MVNNDHEGFDKCDLSIGNVTEVKISSGLKSWRLSKIQSFKTLSTWSNEV